MKNAIKLSEALGWPIAAIIIAIVILVIVLRVTSAKGEFSLGIKDWLKIGTKSPDHPVSQLPPADTLPLSSDSDETTAEMVAEVIEEPPAEVQSSTFWTETSAQSLEESFARFKDSPAYKDDPEFWESIRVDRRRELSVGNEAQELNQLAEQNPTWVWPHIFLIRRYIRLHDSPAAEEILRAALSRENTEKRRWVLREGVTLYYRLFGFERAMQFLREQMNNKILDAETSVITNHLAELSEVEGDLFSSAILREVGITYDQATKKNLFDLAYRYGEVSNYAVIAFQRYALLAGDKDWPSAPNNMGVVAKSASEAVQKEFYEKALTFGSVVAAANLARSLVSDGYIRRAELVLEQVSDAILSIDDAKVLADAKAKVSAARAEMEKKRTAFEDFSRKQDRRYTAAVLAAVRHFKEAGTSIAGGHFASEDGTLTISADPEGAHCTYSVGDKKFTGRLPRKPLCFEGAISTSGGSLLAENERRALILQVGNDLFRAIILPEPSATMDPLRIIDAARVEAPSLLTMDGAVAPQGPVLLPSITSLS